MSKKQSNTFGASFIANFRGAFFGLLFFALVLSAYAAITYPANPSAPSGILGLYVGATASLDGDQGGYTGGNTLCNAVVSGSHVCSSAEIVNTYTHNPSAVTGLSSIVWVNTAASTGTSPRVNDCSGWTDGDYPSFGGVWNFNIDAPGVQQCNASHAFACCR